MSHKQEMKLFDAITNVHDDLIEAALDTQLKANRHKWRKWTAIAACIVVVIGISSALVRQSLLPFGGNAEESSGSGHLGGSSVFMSYAGPVFPLTLSEPDDTITATRNIAYDFSLSGEDDLRVWGTNVTDHYTLSNPSEKDKTVTVLYPFVGSFSDLNKQMPDIAIGGQQVSPALYAGGYSGGFTGVYGDNQPNGSENILELNSWEGYKSLLEDKRYQSNAFSPYPALSQQVTVYTFSDFNAPIEEYHAATQAISFTIDPDKTTILTYGFEGSEQDDDGFRRYSYFVPDGVSMRSNTKLLIVLGEDTTDYTLQGYKNGAIEHGNELDNVSATVTRSQEVLSDVMGRLIEDFFATYGDGTMQTVSDEMFLGAVSEFLYAYGSLSDTTRDRYQNGMFEDMISETKSVNRVFYLEFPVTIPAGEHVALTVGLHKNPSYDFACTGAKNVGIQGYDMVTRLGSNLHFSELTAELVNSELIEIIRQNFGFDLESGLDRVTLDTDTPHYYLEIRTVDKKE